MDRPIIDKQFRFHKPENKTFDSPLSSDGGIHDWPKITLLLIHKDPAKFDTPLASALFHHLRQKGEICRYDNNNLVIY